MVKRVGLQNDFIQVFEYKYGLKNPKSPIKTMHTTWFVGFMGENSNSALAELGTPNFKLRWSKLLENYPDRSLVSSSYPSNVKQLEEAVRLFENVKGAETGR
jgi:hypothetical protein